MKEPKFEVKPLEKEPFDGTQGKPEKEPDVDPALADKGGVEVWEGEGGMVETSKEAPQTREAQGARKEANRQKKRGKELRKKEEELAKKVALIESLDKEWVDIMKSNKEMLTRPKQILLDKFLSDNLPKENMAEIKKFYKGRRHLFKKIFGVTFGIWDGLKYSYQQPSTRKSSFRKLLRSLPPGTKAKLKIHIPDDMQVKDDVEDIEEPKKQGSKIKQETKKERKVRRA